MSEFIFNLIMAPIAWAVESTVVFAVTSTNQQLYIAMGIASFIAVLLIWSMIPRKAKSHNIEPVVIAPYVATEEDEREAREILIGAQAI